MDVSAKYKKLEQREHVLTRPTMYIGSIEPDMCDTWVCDESADHNKITKRTIQYIAGLYKIFDEVLVNAIDHCYRIASLANGGGASGDTIKQVKNIKVTINRDTGMIEILNDGEGIDIALHPEHNIYIPELIFGNLLTSTNYDDTEEKTIGGQNGIGAKCCNIFSTTFTVTTVDAKVGKMYEQTFCGNMSIVQKPRITACKKAPFTSIKFIPDFEKFGTNCLSEDMYALFRKRALDVCAVTPPTVAVTLDGEKLSCKTFERYVDMYIGSKVGGQERIYEQCGDKWEVIVAPSTTGFEHVSFVNGICTFKGGKHVDHVVSAIVKSLGDLITKRKKVTSKPQHIKDNMIVFIKSTIVNPTFDSQTKECLVTPPSKFGSKFEPSEKFIEKIYKSAITAGILNMTSSAQETQAAKTDGKKRSTIRGLAKLDDANFAGTNKSKDCTLILTEGDSAKTMALAGLSVVGRDYYGVFPLRGKLLNVKDVPLSKVAQNEEITSLKKIIGLENGKSYSQVDDLRYGKIMIMTDQDSVSGDTPMLLRDPYSKLMYIKPISQLASVFESGVNPNGVVKEYGETNMEVWTEQGWTFIKHVMRHKTMKKMYRVCTATSCVDVTEDHSLLNSERAIITPEECVVGMNLLHSFPMFFDMQTHVFTASEAYVMGVMYGSNSKPTFGDVHRMLREFYGESDESLLRARIIFAYEDRESIPIDILNGSVQVRTQFLTGFAEASSSGHLFVVKSKVLAMGLYFILRSVGCDAGVECVGDVEGDYILLKERAGCSNMITAIHYLGETDDYVYDVETTNHHFHAGIGQMIVHNTDGSHIKGLIFNMFHTMWPSLLQHPGFIKSMITPIVKVRKGTQAVSFYNLTDYEEWRAARDDAHTWKVKYYKGLGTSTAEEAKEYFKQLNVVDYVYDGDENIDLAFNKKRADDRKRWIEEYDYKNVLSNARVVSYNDFILKELAHFSHYNIERSIPSICDGLKPSQRKIMFGVFKRGAGEVKVEQLGGYVSEHAAYHHGESSLHGAIIGLAQDFVGSNNIELLTPIGQFGSRIQGGKDAASPRYIFCDINPLARDIFIKEDLPILKHLEDDGQMVEPEWYIPIIPMVLVNGAKGIGTGFSTEIPNFNPLDVIENVRAYIDGVDMKPMVPWYRAFEGTIIVEENDDGKVKGFTPKGTYVLIGNTLEITELPIGSWTENYKHFLEEYIDKNPKVLKDYSSQYTDVKVKFVLHFFPGALEGKDIEKEFKLVGKTLSITNVHLINADGHIQKYTCIEDIVREFCDVRLRMYTLRKEHQIKELERDIAIAKSRVLFIEEVQSGVVDIMNLSKDELVEKLDHHFKVDGCVDYLIRMPMYNLTTDKVNALRADIDALEEKLRILVETTEREIWKTELDVLESNYRVALSAYMAKNDAANAPPPCKRRKK